MNSFRNKIIIPVHINIVIRNGKTMIWYYNYDINDVTNIYYLQLLYKKRYTCFVSFNKINSSFTKCARTGFISGVFG